MSPQILKIEQVAQSDEAGQLGNYKQVTWLLGDDGPFVYTCREVDFDPDTIAAHIKADAEKMTALRARLGS